MRSRREMGRRRSRGEFRSPGPRSYGVSLAAQAEAELRELPLSNTAPSPLSVQEHRERKKRKKERKITPREPAVPHVQRRSASAIPTSLLCPLCAKPQPHNLGQPQSGGTAPPPPRGPMHGLRRDRKSNIDPRAHAPHIVGLSTYVYICTLHIQTNKHLQQQGEQERWWPIDGRRTCAMQGLDGPGLVRLAAEFRAR